MSNVEISGTANKRPCLDKKKIGTHNGSFHCDEVLACYMLTQLPEYKDADVVRTRDPAILEECDIVVDVGGVYDAARHRYDHHQRTFVDTMNSLNSDYEWTTKLSSAGLVYFHFGRRIIAQLLGCNPDDKLVSVLYKKVYEGMVQEVDAIDNGVNICEETPKYQIHTGVSSRVGHLNPRWNEESVDVQARFEAAMQLVGAEFSERVDYYGRSWWPARELVLNAISKRKEVDESGAILSFGDGHCPWKEHLLNLEDELGIVGEIKFVLFTDQNGAWRVQCVPVDRTSFNNRLSLLSEWCGVRDQELSEKSGIPGCIFVHANGFIGGNKTYEGALQMAKQTLNNKPHAAGDS